MERSTAKVFSKFYVRFADAGLPVVDIEELKRKAYLITGVPEFKPARGRVVANILYRDGQLIDQIRQR